jgi:hypothetical protein
MVAWRFVVHGGETYASSSNPVSDRYMITCYGGAIDVVHVFSQGAAVCSGGATVEEAVLHQWKAEKGMEFVLNGLDPEEPAEAKPDDLPSNAFGALFGEEIKDHENDPDFDLPAAWTEFFRPTLILPDRIARLFSHKEIVLGLPNDDVARTDPAYLERNTWFTAEPNVQCERINKRAMEAGLIEEPVCEKVQSGREGLERAGFELRTYRYLPIVIRRLPAASVE